VKVLRIPLWLEMEGRRVLVVGGGNVGTRRALKFLEAGACVRVLSLYFSDLLRREASRNPRLELVEGDASREDVVREHVGWADIVVIATDKPEVNELVWSIAKSMRKWVNDATNAERTEVVVPYEGEVFGGLRFAVTSEGKSGVAARWARDRVKRCLERDLELKTLFEAMTYAKQFMKKAIPDAKKRFPIYFEIEEDPMFRKAVERGDVEEAKKRAEEIILGKARELGYTAQT